MEKTAWGSIMITPVKDDAGHASNMASRISTYGAMAHRLALLSNRRLLELLESATPIGTGIGGKTALLKIDDISIFVKKVRLTDIELFALA